MKKFSLWVMLTLFSATVLLSGCGQKSDLYHPTDEDKLRRDRRN